MIDNKGLTYDELIKVKGRTPQQKKCLKYLFQEGGCLSPCMKDVEYDQMVMEVVKSTDWKKKALNTLGVDEDEVQEVAPIHLEAYDHRLDSSIAQVGKDLKWRSSHYMMTWLFCSSTQVYVWQYTFSMIDSTKQERTEEYFYKDITNFSARTETKEKLVSEKHGCSGNTKLKPRSFDNQLFSIIVPGDKLDCEISEETSIDSTVQGLRAKLREKKNN